MRDRLLLATALTIALPVTVRAEAPFDFAHAPGQLPKTVVPSAYRIDIVTDMAMLTLAGRETIDVTVAADPKVDRIVMNQAGLKITHVMLDARDVTSAIRQDEAAQTLTIAPECRASPCIHPGHHTLTLDYTGPIPATPNGIYYDDYKDPAGASKRMLVTQFEVADARRMFPGWDEPAFKASFALSVTMPKSYVPVGNMPVTSTTPVGSDAKRVTFATTPRMSTYLLAVFAGDLAALHGHAASGPPTPINAYAPAGEQQNAAYALHAASDILPYYNGYFGVPYPLPKLDLIAVPGNYEAGAMENWGAISFIDDTILFDPKTSAPRTQEEIYLVVAHEMAHQWSGDLVTMGWWDNIWLNEGFATWMENKATDHFNPSWQIWPRQHGDREAAMGQDALPTTHPIQQTIRDVSEANSAFDQISYQKGGQVIRMIEDWLSPDVFRDGMRSYMRAHAYSSTTSADLWAALSGVAHKDVAAVATSFTEQPGIPLVSVARACTGGQTALTLSQSRFTIHDSAPRPITWSIPVTAGGPGQPVQKVLLWAAPATLHFAGCDHALKANLGENGYYRVAYDAASLTALTKGFTTLDATDRTNLLGDQFALFEAGRASLATYMDLVASLGQGGEQSYAVWQDTLAHLRRLDRLEQGRPVRTALRAFERRLEAPLLGRLGWTPKPHESFLDTLLRPSVITALGEADDPAVIAEAQRRFAAFLKTPSSLPPSLLDPVTLIVGIHADRATYMTLAGLARAAPDTEQKLRYFNAMAASHDPALIRQTVQITYSGAVPNGRIAGAIAGISMLSDDPGLVWSLVQPNQAVIRPMLAPTSQAFLLPAAAFGTMDPAIVKAMLDDPASSKDKGAKIEAARAADAIRTNIALRDRADPALSAWLAAHPG